VDTGAKNKTQGAEKVGEGKVKHFMKLKIE
jgi:hypothetical protein